MKNYLPLIILFLTTAIIVTFALTRQSFFCLYALVLLLIAIGLHFAYKFIRHLCFETRKLLKVEVSNNLVFYDVDQRHKADAVGPFQPTWSRSYIINDERWIANGTFVDYMLAKYPDIVPYQRIRELYALDKYNPMSSADRVRFARGTVYVTYMSMIARQDERAVDEVDCQDELENKYKVSDLKRAMRIYRRNGSHYIRFICLLAALAASASGITYGAYRGVSVIAYHLNFNAADYKEPPPFRPRTRINHPLHPPAPKACTRSISLVDNPPPFRNQEFNRNASVNVTAAMRYRLAAYNGPLALDERLVECIHHVIDDLIKLFPFEDYTFIDPYDTAAVHTWIDSRPYLQSRKQQLHQQVDTDFPQRKKNLDPHIKQESYPKPSRPRFIVARVDGGKIVYGPLFQNMNDWFFHLPFTTKHIPTQDRPAYISNYLHGDKYFVTDHTAFEAAAVKEVQDLFEMRVYKAILPEQFHACLDELTAPVHMTERNTKIGLSCDAIRWSGEMNTSLGNSIMNYASIMAAAEYLGYQVTAVVEGDDALIGVPAEASKVEYARVMAMMGFNIKIDEYIFAGDAGYCSMYWDHDLNVAVKLTDRLPDVCWTNPQSLLVCTREELLMAKLAALSVECPYLPGMWMLFNDTAVNSPLNQYEVEMLGATVGDKCYSYHGRQGREPTLQERVNYQMCTHFDVGDQFLVESLAGNVEEAITYMYEACCDTTFAREQYIRQVH